MGLFNKIYMSERFNGLTPSDASKRALDIITNYYYYCSWDGGELIRLPKCK